MRTDTNDVYQEARDTACCQLEMLTIRLTVEYVPDVRYYHCVAKTRGTPHPSGPLPCPRVSPSCYHLRSLHHNTTHYHTLQLLSTLEQMTKPPVLSMTRFSCPLLGHARAASRLHTQFRTFTISRHASHSTEKPTQHEKEDFYQYYLNIDLPDKNMSRKLWPKQPIALSPDLALLQEPQSNADSVAYVLDSFVRSHQRHAKQPIAKALDQYREAKPGSLALRWLLRSEKLHELGR